MNCGISRAFDILTSMTLRHSLLSLPMILAASFVIVACGQKPDPIVRGKPVSYWIERVRSEKGRLNETSPLWPIVELGAEGFPICRAALQDKDPAVRAFGIICCGELPPDDIIDALGQVMRNGGQEIREQALQALLICLDESPRATTVLSSLLNDPDPALNMLAAHEFGNMDPEVAGPGLLPMLDGGKPKARAAAAAALAQMRNPPVAATAPLIHALKDGYTPLRASAASALGQLPDGKRRRRPKGRRTGHGDFRLASEARSAEVMRPRSRAQTGDRIHLDQAAVVQGVHRRHGAGGFVVAKIAGVNGVDPAPQANIAHVNGRFEHAVKPAPGRFQDGLEVFQCAFRLGFDFASDGLAAGGIERQYAGNVYQTGMYYGLRVMPAWGRGVGGMDDFHFVLRCAMIFNIFSVLFNPWPVKTVTASSLSGLRSR